LNNPSTRFVARFAAPLTSSAVFLAFSLLFFQQSKELYVIDEAEFPLVARAIAQTGRPIYYRGEDLPANVGIWHPPLYPYTLGAWEQVFGFSHVAVRSFGFACALIAAAFGLLIIRRLFDDPKGWLRAAWLGIFLLHPYAIQSALLPDIDSTVLVASSMFALWALTEAVVAHRWTPLVTSVIFGVALGINALAKLTTPIALIPLMIISLALSTRSFRWTLVGTALFSAIAATLFSAVWGFIAVVARVDFGYPFSFTYQSLISRSGSKSVAQHIHDLWPGPSVLFWLTPLLLIAFIVGMLAALRLARGMTGQALLLIGSFAAMVFFAYNVITGPPFGFPKYYAPALGPMAIVAIAPFGLPRGEFLAWRHPWSTRRFLVVAALVVVIIDAGYLESARRSTHTAYPEWPLWLLISIGLVFAVGLSVLVRPLPAARSRFFFLGSLAAATVLAVLVVTNLSTDMRQRSAPGSVRYFPGERDFSVTIAKLRALTLNHASEEHAILISAKDVGYESGIRYYEDDFYLGDPQRLGRLLRSSPKMLMVTRNDYDFSALVWPNAFRLIRRLAHPIWVSPSGTFTIWKTDTRGKGHA
jgi:4-amino-4-deoxy-L-arabinose transferase-like glycosyltransferase